MAYHDTHHRTLIKTISWRVLATLVTLSVTYAYTGKLIDSFAITGTAALISTIIFYIHERVWNRIHWGKLRRD